MTIVEDGGLDKIVEIEVRGEHGVGYCNGMPRAVWPFERLKVLRREYQAKS